MPRRATPLLLAAVVAIVVAACSGTIATPVPTASPGASEPTPAGPTSVPGGSAATPPATSGTFTTAWGTAREAVPPGFPVPLGGRPADPSDPVAGPVSGAWVVEGSPAEVAQAMEARLDAAGYRTAAIDGPNEDGGLVISSAGPDPACRVQTTVRPLGGMTIVEVLFGAACPFG